jgi:hypothetical protein
MAVILTIHEIAKQSQAILNVSEHCTRDYTVTRISYVLLSKDTGLLS